MQTQIDPVTATPYLTEGLTCRIYSILHMEWTEPEVSIKSDSTAILNAVAVNGKPIARDRDVGYLCTSSFAARCLK